MGYSNYKAILLPRGEWPNVKDVFVNLPQNKRENYSDSPVHCEHGGHRFR